MNMLNRNCKTSFAKPEFLKKAQRANPHLYDIGCYNDNLALMLAPDSDEMIHLEKERRSKLSDLIRPFDYDQLNNLYDLGKRCEKNYSSVRRYVADPVNAYPKRSITKLILKGAVIFDVVSYQFRCALNYSKLVRKL
ncbi:hypothetical protein Tco_0712598 [Tanacetum coccineum]